MRERWGPALAEYRNQGGAPSLTEFSLAFAESEVRRTLEVLRERVETMTYYGEMLGPEHGQMTEHRMAIHADILAIIDKAKP